MVLPRRLGHAFWLAVSIPACTTFGSPAPESDASPPGDASTVAPPMLDGGAPDAPTLPEAGPRIDLGPSCDTSDLTKSLATTLDPPRLGDLVLSEKVPTGSQVSVVECPGASGRCFSTKISKMTQAFAGFEVDVPLGQASTSRMRVCFHVRVALDYDALERQKEWATLAAMNKADPMTSVQLWPKTNDGSWAFIGTATRVFPSTSTWSTPAENRALRWHKVQLDTTFGANGNVTVTVDGKTARPGGAVGVWDVGSGLFSFGLLPGPSPFEATAWFQDVRFAWQ